MKRSYLLVAAVGLLLLTAATIDLNNLINYAGQTVPSYILKDNTPVTNPITDKGALLGRVLFYDKQLSVFNNKSCGTCHQQQFAFTDTIGLGGYGTTDSNSSGNTLVRRSMRLVNSRFSEESKFFWDERATSLEDQTSQPIKNHDELGFSNTNGHPGIDGLITRMNTIPYYPQLFNFVFGSPEITEAKIQLALAQFIRSIQSYDSKYDVGRAQVGADNVDFPNFTYLENLGKQVFMAPPPTGAGCQGCHVAPEFDIAANSGNNGITGFESDTTGNTKVSNITRSPSLRNLVNNFGVPNGPYMHNGQFKTLAEVIDHYNHIVIDSSNTNLDPKLIGPGGLGQDLNLTNEQKNALVAFLRTLTGNDLYTNPRWADPFDVYGRINIIALTTGLAQAHAEPFTVYPNPATDWISFNLPTGKTYTLQVFAIDGKLVQTYSVAANQQVDITDLEKGIYLVNILDNQKHLMTKKIQKVSL